MTSSVGNCSPQVHALEKKKILEEIAQVTCF